MVHYSTALLVFVLLGSLLPPTTLVQPYLSLLCLFGFSLLLLVLPWLFLWRLEWRLAQQSDWLTNRRQWGYLQVTFPWLIGFYTLIYLLVCQWPTWLWYWRLPNWPGCHEFLVAAPLLCVELNFRGVVRFGQQRLLVWAKRRWQQSQRRQQRRVPFPSHNSLERFDWRFWGRPLLFWMVLIGIAASSRQLPRIFRFLAIEDWLLLFFGLSIAFVLILVWCWPLLICWFTVVRPLPNSELRTALLQLAQQQQLQLAQLLEWQSEQAVNAAVTGVLAQRSVALFSPALLRQFSERQILTIFGHELGHLKYGHLLFNITFTLLCFSTSSLLALALARLYWQAYPIYSVTQLSGQLWGFTLLQLCLSLGIWLPSFGYFSRRMERQADLFACTIATDILHCESSPLPPVVDVGSTISQAGSSRIVSTEKIQAGVDWYIQTLETVAQFNPWPVTTWSWRHGSLASRLRFLQQQRQQPEQFVRWHRFWNWERRLTLLLLGSLFLLLGLWSYLS